MWLNRWRSLTLRYILGIFLVLALAGCVSIATPTATLEPSLTDQSILTDAPCVAPCWYGLELGKSTKADALKIAQTLSFVDPKDFPETADHYMYSTQEYVPATSVNLMCRQPKKDGCAVLLFVNDSLKQISLYPNYSLSFGEVVAHLGVPDYIGFAPLQVESGSLCGVGVIWKQRGVVANFSSGGGHQNQVQCNKVYKDPRINKDLPVQAITYLLPESYALASVPQPGADFPWVGFIEP